MVDAVDFASRREQSILRAPWILRGLLYVLALYVFGTSVIHGFAFAMLFGIVIGTYSSIFVAAPLLLWFGVKRDWSGNAVASKGEMAAKAKP